VTGPSHVLGGALFVGTNVSLLTVLIVPRRARSIVSSPSLALDQPTAVTVQLRAAGLMPVDCGVAAGQYTALRTRYADNGSALATAVMAQPA